jgi:preprotein translocase subunit SecE
VARDRKRAKQRRQRGTAGSSRGKAPAAPPSQPVRADLPGSLDHASGEVDEFDAALVRGAGGVPATPERDVEADTRHLSEREIEEEAAAEGDISDDELQELEQASGGAGGSNGDGGGVTPERASGAPLRGGNRAIGFLRASWAELQRVHRRAVTQATAVVLGFVAIAGAYLGLADYVAKEFVEFIL